MRSPACFWCLVIFLSLFSCANTLKIPQNTPKCSLPLYSTPKLTKNVALVKHSLLRFAAALLSVPSDVFTTPPMIEPPSESNFERNYRITISALLAQGWNELEDGATTTRVSKSNDTIPSGHDPFTYGEITELGSRQLFHYMKVKSYEDVHFFDLGSGHGKLTVQAFLEVPRLQRAVGVELVSARHEIATRAWNSIQSRALSVRSTLLEQQGLSDMEESATSVKFIHGNLFQVDVTKATHVYVASLCFTSAMMEMLGDKLGKEARELKCVATLKPFSTRHEWSFGVPTMEYVEMSWTRSRGEGCVVYFYTPPSLSRLGVKAWCDDFGARDERP